MRKVNPQQVDRQECVDREVDRPQPSPSFRRRAWREFQRALDPLAPIKPLRAPRTRMRG